jgi:hypothetical protein
LKPILRGERVAEIEDGITQLHREGATRRAKDLADWLNAVLHLSKPRLGTWLRRHHHRGDRPASWLDDPAP